MYVYTTGQMITQPPVSTTAALGTNATFACHGDAQVFWKITGTSITSADQLPIFAREKIYASLPTPRFSELIMTATAENNFTRTIQCLVTLGYVDTPVESEIVYGECKLIFLAVHTFLCLINPFIINLNHLINY